jgi:tetratricopeptide (TPR) repeat protein
MTMFNLLAEASRSRCRHGSDVDERLERARLMYEHAVFGGDADALSAAERELDSVEADLTLARGRILHARFLERRDENASALALFERAALLYRGLGDLRGEGESLFWIGCSYQVFRGDNAAAIPVLERAHELATQAGDALTESYALRHLAIAEHAAGRLETARERLEESTRLRKEIGFLPGVAANLVGLAYIAAAQDRRPEAQALLDEARTIAEACSAEGITHQIDEACERLVAAQ